MNNKSVFLDTFWPSNGIEIRIYYKSDVAISEYISGFKYYSDSEEI